jgi:phage terminase large subunit-like protein
MKDYVAIARQYRDEVRRDKRGKHFCKWVRLACEREYQDQQRAAGGKWDYYFSEWHANDVCDFIEKLPHLEGEWCTPTITLEPWQIFILVTIFGWRRQRGDERSRNDYRRFNTVYIEVARGNGKSLLSAGIALYCLCCEGEPGPQVKVAATSGSQARIVFDFAKKQVEATPDLKEAFGLSPMANSIMCWQNGGHIKPINSKASTQDGLGPHLSIIDELHAHKDRGLFDVLKSARGKRKNPLSWYITTAGYSQVGVCYEQRTLVTKTLEKILDGEHYFGIIFTLDDEVRGGEGKVIRKKDDPFDECSWKKANPNYGISVDPIEFRATAREAQQSPQSEGEFKTKKCNLWLNAAQAWLNMAQWDLCADFSLKIEQFYGRDAWLAADLSSRLDITALILLTLTDEGLPVWFGKFFLPEDNVKELSKKHAHYIAWEKQGLFTLTPGNYIDYDLIESNIEEWAGLFNIRSGIAFDNKGSQQIAGSLEKKGHTTVIMPYTSKEITPAALDLEGKIQARLCRHDGNPIMKWMASNTVVDRRVDGTILPKKESKDSANKIDGIAGLLMAWSRMRAEDDSQITQGFVRL